MTYDEVVKELNENLGRGATMTEQEENAQSTITLSEEDCLQTYPFETLYVFLGMILEILKESKINPSQGL